VNTASLQRQFDKGGLPGNAALADLRSRAFERFSATGFPSRRHEDWRYTDLKPIADAQFELGASAPDGTRTEALRALLAPVRLDHAGPTLVFVDGAYSAGLSHPAAAAGATIASLAEHWDRLDSHYTGSVAESRHPLANLNTAFSREGALIEIPDGMQVDAPVHLVFVGDGARTAPQPRVIVAMGANAELTIVQHFVDCRPATTWLNLVTQIDQSAGSRLRLYRLQQHGLDAFHTSLLHARLARDASLTGGYIDLGGRLVRNDIDVTLAEPGAEVDLFGLCVASGKQHIDNHLRVDHAAPNTRSNEEFRGIAGDHGHSVFNGKVIVQRGSQRIDARQSSDNLLLSEHATIDTKPELEIYADDVKCSHGATIGELDERQLFYLRTRGIDEDTARGLLTFAFANRVMDRIAIDSLRERVSERVAGELPDRGLWEALL
jgi:Fe-S cluster assembly protein SufD